MLKKKKEEKKAMMKVISLHR